MKRKPGKMMKIVPGMIIDARPINIDAHRFNVFDLQLILNVSSVSSTVSGRPLGVCTALSADGVVWTCSVHVVQRLLKNGSWHVFG